MATTEEQQKPKRRILWGQLGFGATIIALAATCAGADIYNNAVFGLEKSAPIAVAFIVAGVGLVILPSMATGKRDLQVGGLVLVCALLSLFAGYQNHMASQKNHDLANAAETKRYNDAQEAIRTAVRAYNDAKAEAAAIAETGDVDALKAELEASQRLYEDNKASCGPICKKAREKMELLPARLGQAKAKADANTRAREAWAAKERAEQGAPAQAKAAGISSQEETIMAILLLLLTIGGATLSDRGYHLIRGAFTYEQPRPVKKPAPSKKPEPEQLKEEKKSDLQRAVEACFEVIDNEAEEWMSPEKALNRVHTYYDQHYPKKAKPTKTALGTAMGEKGAKFPKGKVNGQQRYGVRFTKLAKVA